MDIHVTDMRQFQDCRLKWWFSSPLKRNMAPNLPSIPIFIGSLFHEAIEAWHNTFFKRTSSEWALADGLDAIVAEAEKTFEHPGFVYSSKTVPTEGYAAAIDLATAMFEHYAMWAPGRWEIIEVERPFRVNIPMPKTGNYSRGVLKGTMDAIVRYRGDLWVLEVKTAGNAAKGQAKEMNLDLQMSAYLWASRKLGYKTKGVLRLTAFKILPKKPEMTQKGRLSKRRITTTHEMYMQAIVENELNPDDYIEKLDELLDQENPCFALKPFEKAEAELRVVERRLYNTYRQMSSPVIYPNEGMFCRNCWFLEPCLAMNQGLDFEWLLEEDYHVSTRR
jgi:CRISPR/Cas system-associated exonuclease Cas4 (RecB family)